MRFEQDPPAASYHTLTWLLYNSDLSHRVRPERLLHDVPTSNEQGMRGSFTMFLSHTGKA